MLLLRRRNHRRLLLRMFTLMRLIPPVWMLIAILGVIAIAYFDLGPIWIDRPFNLIGYAVSAIGFITVYACFRQFRTHKTAIHPGHDSSSLITTGLFRFSRNPIYIAMTVIILGAVMVSARPAALIMPILFGLVIDRLFIRMEERKLIETFGDDYSAYKARCRRWI